MTLIGALGSDHVFSRPLRVIQLDASELDNRIFEIFKVQLKNVLKYLKPYYLFKYDSEISLLVRFVIWHFSINKTGATLAQKTLNMKYVDESLLDASARQAIELGMTKKQKKLFCLYTVFLPWLKETFEKFLPCNQRNYYEKDISSVYKVFQCALGFLKVIDFLIFLTRGDHHGLIERILGIRSLHPQVQSVRQVCYEMTDREILWQGFAELLFFLIPLVNLKRFNRILRENVFQIFGVSTNGRSDVILGTKKKMECGICRESSTNPHMISCGHVFCYYCIASNFKADQRYKCPSCQRSIKSVEDIRPASVLMNLSSDDFVE